MKVIFGFIGSIQKILLGSSLAAILVFLYIFPISSYDQMLLFAFGHIEVNEIKYIYPLFLFISPILILLMICGTWIREEMVKRGAIIFTRLTKSTEWFMNIVIQLFLFSFVYVSFIFTSLYILGLIFQSSVYVENMNVVVIVFTKTILFYFIVVLLTNVVAVYLNSQLAYSFTLLIITLSLFISSFLYEIGQSQSVIMRLLPTSQIMTLWHTYPIFDYIDRTFYLNNFSLMYSYSYLFVVCFFLLGLLYMKLKKIEVY